MYPKPHPAAAEFKRTGDFMPVMSKFARIAPSGLMRYRSSVFGPEYRDNLFTAQFNPHRVQRHVVFREGASFRTEDSDFLTSTDPDFHPTDVFEDADGSLLVLDTGAWFIHGCPLSQIAKPEVKGAVYRIRRKGAAAPLDPRGDGLNLAAMPPADLARLLEDARPFVQDRATELLVSAGDAAVPALQGARRSSPNYEARAAAVFALFRVGTPAARAAVREALDDADFRVRTAAARCAGMAGDRDAEARLTAMAGADHPAARRQAAAALGQLGDAGTAGALLATAARAEDRFTEHSVIYSLIQLGSSAPLEAALREGPPAVRKAALIALDQMDGSPLRSEDAARLLAAPEKELRASALWVVSHHPEWAGVVGEYLSSKLHEPSLPEDEVEPVRDALRAFLAAPEIQGRIAGWLGDVHGERQTALLLDAIEQSPMPELPASWTERIGVLLESGDANTRQRAVELVRARSIPGLEDRLARIAADPKAPDALRASALSVLVGRNPKLDSSQYEFLTTRLETSSDPILRQTVARVIGRSAPAKDQLLALARRSLAHADPLVMSTVLDCFRSTNDAEVGGALVSVLEQSPAALGTLGEERLRALFAAYPAVVQEQAKGLYRRLEEAQQARVERLRKLLPLLSAAGDAGRGRRIFFGPKVACASCHTIGMEGGKVGPDLTGIGAIRSGHDLLEAIVFPSVSFVPGHEVFVVDLGHDRLSGVIRSQNRDAVVLVTGPNGEVRIPRREIKSMQQSKVSLMPEGFDESLTKSELTDLLAFLQAEKARPKASRTAP